MTNVTMGSLRELQRLDERIDEVRAAITGFDDRLAEVESPALALEAELSQLQNRLAQMRSDSRRLERAADDKKARAEKAELRLNRVSNLREEAAVRTELDLIRKAISGDEQEALQLIDQVGRTELTVDDLEARATAAREKADSGQAALLKERERLDGLIADLQSRRQEILAGVADLERRVYESFHQSGRSVVVAQLLEDGACGNCYGVIPLQLQQEVRQAERLIRCEACGVILTTESEPVVDPALMEPLHLSRPEDFEDDAGVEREAEAGEESDAEEAPGGTRSEAETE